MTVQFDGPAESPPPAGFDLSALQKFMDRVTHPTFGEAVFASLALQGFKQVSDGLGPWWTIWGTHLGWLLRGKTRELDVFKLMRDEAFREEVRERLSPFTVLPVSPQGGGGKA